MSCLAGGKPTMTLLSQSAGRGPSSLSASRSTSVRDMDLTRSQSVLLSPRASFRLILSAEKREIFSFFRISCPPERDKPYGLRALSPYDSEESTSPQSHSDEAFFAVPGGWVRVYRPTIEQPPRPSNRGRVRAN